MGENHWNEMYSSRSPQEVGWYEEKPELSLQLISKALQLQSWSFNSVSLIDIGGGTSSLAHHLKQNGAKEVSVIDISPIALEIAKKSSSFDIQWIVGDVTNYKFKEGYYNIWHDRAAFHFLTEEAERKKYVKQAAKALILGGILIVGTFAEDGPKKCSNLDVRR
jgi:SAM-dependent methyltransferase